jgi:ribose transport system substrate-binding protein
MRKFRKVLALTLALALMVAVMAGCKSKDDGAAADGGLIAPLSGGKDIRKDEIKIGFITLSTAGIGTKMHEKAFAEQLAFYPNVTLKFLDAEYNPANQKTLLNECVTQKFDAVILECMDTEALNGAISEAENAGIPVITMNSGASGLHTLHIEGSDYEAGWNGGKILSEAIGGTGSAILLDVPPEQKAVGRMGTGFEEYLAQNTEIKLLEKPGIANWSMDNGRDTMSALLTKYPNPGDINIVYAASDDIGMGAIQAIEAAGRENEGILVYANMGYPEGLQAIKDGRLFGTGFSDIYLEDTAALMLVLQFIATGTNSISAGYEKTPVLSMWVPPCTPDNVDDIIAISHWADLYDFH